MSAVADRFVPTGNGSRYNPPRAWIDRDQSKSWLRRALPIVLARRRTLFSALGLSFASLMLQVQIPNLLNSAVTHSLQHHATPLGHYVRIVFALAVAAGLSSYLARLLLMRTAYGIESDLRNMIYTHLTRMSFDFYDRVQSGQLISRANSDIRSVQMYLTFGPNIIVQCSIALVAFIYMLTINVPLAFVAMCTLPVVFLMGVRMRKSLFPVSWLIQSRLAEVATTVDENINGVRVVKSFVAEPRELLWVEDPVDLFFLQIQGSGKVTLDTGETVRLAYADQNGHPYKSVGRLLVERGELTLDQASMQGIRAWGQRNPDKLGDLLNTNASYVFFREQAVDTASPAGALGVQLTPGRSLAVDPRVIPLGAPVFLSTTQPTSTQPLHRLMAAQDTGGAIKGAVRADLFWGSGDEAGALAGRMRQTGRLWVLLPSGSGSTSATQ